MILTEDGVLRLVTNAHEALTKSSSKWAINYWTTVLKRLEVRYPYYGRFKSN